MEFIGRKAEINQLEQLLTQIDTGDGCKVVNFVAETGIGKSRLVQEFYNRITNHEYWDPAFCNYWPDAFQTITTQLHVTPTMTDHKPKGPPRFLWFGLRWSNNLERNIISSSMLPELAVQVRTHAKVIQSQQEIWKQYLTQIKTHAPYKISETVVEQVFEALLSNFIPSANIAIELFKFFHSTSSEISESTTVTDVLGHHHGELKDDLLLIFRHFCRSASRIPIIIWLDDVQWMDNSSYDFLRTLYITAKAAKWPILFISTCWPLEWNQMSSDHFLKQGQLIELIHPSDDELLTYLKRELPGLTAPDESLILTKSDGNYLSLIENIGQLRSEPLFFVKQDFNKGLSKAGIEEIKTWSTFRTQRIAQRFQALTPLTRATLARASYLGITFLPEIIRVFAERREITQINTLLDQCVSPLVLISQVSPHTQEFRDRGYFNIAAQYFDRLLKDDDLEELIAVIKSETARWIHDNFSDDGEIIEDGALLQLSYTEQQVILQLALQSHIDSPKVWLRALALSIESHANKNMWDEVNELTTQLDQHDWDNHDYTVLNYHTCEHLIMYSQDSGNIPIAYKIAKSYINYWRNISNQDPTEKNLHALSLALNYYGNILVTQDEHAEAISIYLEDASIQRNLYAQTNKDFYRHELSVVLNKLNYSYARTGDMINAQNAVQESVQIMEYLLASDDSIHNQKSLAYALSDLARTKFVNNEREGLDVLLNQIKQIRQKIYDAEPTHDHLASLAFIMHKIMLNTPNRPDKIAQMHLVIPMTQKIALERKQIQDFAEHAEMLGELGYIYHQEHDNSSAIHYLHEALTHSQYVLDRRGVLQDLLKHRDILLLIANIDDNNLKEKPNMTSYKYYVELKELNNEIFIREPKTYEAITQVLILCGIINHTQSNHTDSVIPELLNAQNIINNLQSADIPPRQHLLFIKAWYQIAQIGYTRFNRTTREFLIPALTFMQQHNIHTSSEEGNQLYTAIETLLQDIM